MADTEHRNRQPKGSPSGGEFAAEVGAEATATLAPSLPALPANIDAILYAAHTRRLASDAKVSIEKRNHLRRVIANACEVVSLVCPAATKITWTPSGSDEYPELNSPEITCPHEEERGGNVWLFEQAHGLMHGTLNGAIGGDTIAKDDMVDFGEDAGVRQEPNQRWGDGDIFTVDLTNAPKYPFTPKVAGPIAEAQLREHRDQYAELGLRVAASMGAQKTWNGGDMLDDTAGWVSQLRLERVGDQTPEGLAHYRSIAAEYDWGLGYGDDE